MMLCVRMKEGMSLRNPMKKILIAAALIVSGLLSGCNQLTQYTVSEQEINQPCRSETISPKILV